MGVLAIANIESGSAALHLAGEEGKYIRVLTIKQMKTLDPGSPTNGFNLFSYSVVPG
jgi:hypothetical protein